MLKSYFLIALRSLAKQKGYSAIKILGLAFGLAASVVIYLFVREDLSYDTFHDNYDRIVRVLTIDNAEGVSSKLVGVTQPPLGPAVRDELPEVVNSARISGGGRFDLSYEDKLLRCDAGFRTNIQIGPEIFILAGIASVGIALLTVSFQSVRAALANPVESLRTE